MQFELFEIINSGNRLVKSQLTWIIYKIYAHRQIFPHKRTLRTRLFFFFQWIFHKVSRICMSRISCLWLLYGFFSPIRFAFSLSFSYLLSLSLTSDTFFLLHVFATVSSTKIIDMKCRIAVVTQPAEGMHSSINCSDNWWHFFLPLCLWELEEKTLA